MNRLSLLLRKCRRKIGKFFLPETSSEEFNEILKKHDIDVGENTVFYGADSIITDVQRPWLIKIGAYTKITQGTVILSHDYSRSVLRRKYGDLLCEARTTEIGNNVFIGMNSIILMGTHIGDNVIVGAGSVVSGKIPDNVVVAGNPARVVRTLDEHYQIRKSRQIDEAKILARAFYKKYNKYPQISDMGAFFPLYLKRDMEEIEKWGLSMRLGGDDEEEVVRDFMHSTPTYENYDAFLRDTFDLDEDER